MKKLFSLFLMVALVFSLFGCDMNKPADVENTTGSSTQQSNEGKLKVEFFNSDDIKLKEGFVSEGESIQAPDVNTEKPGYIFSGWDKDLSKVSKEEASNQENGDEISVVVKPEYIDVTDKENVIAIPTVYKDSDGKITVQVSMRGKVNFCGLDLKIKYDADVLSFVEFENTDPSVVVNHDEEKAEIYMNFASSTNTTGDVDFTNIVFKSKSVESTRSSLKIEIVEIIKVDSEAFTTPEYSVISSYIYA